MREAVQFQLREALPHYAAAARLHATSPQYAYRYAVVLQQQGQYTEAEPLYRAALQALRPLVSADPTTYVSAVPLKRTRAATPVVCARLHEAARVVSDARLTHMVQQRLQAWCGATGQQEQR